MNFDYPLETLKRRCEPHWLPAHLPITLYCEFARLDAGITRLPDESTILRFRHLLEAHNLSIQLLTTITPP
jgi:hypothetical protein